MILCVTPNTALDRTLVVPGYRAGGVFRPQQLIVAAGGKGVNVARAIRVLGGDALCLGFIAGHVGALVASIASAEGLDARWTRLKTGETRTCTILVDPAFEQPTVVNESGVITSADDWAQLRHDLIAAAASAQTICLCGSLPPGTPVDDWTALLADLRAMGKTVWVDSSGVGLAAAVEVRGISLKVNDDEAAALLKQPITTPEEAAACALTQAKQSAASIVITMGARGAVLSDGNATLHAVSPTIDAKSAVGSGDSLLAGLLVGLESGEPPDLALRSGVAAGAANALSIGGGQFGLDDFAQILSNTSCTELYIH